MTSFNTIVSGSLGSIGVSSPSSGSEDGRHLRVKGDGRGRFRPQHPKPNVTAVWKLNRATEDLSQIPGGLIRDSFRVGRHGGDRCDAVVEGSRWNWLTPADAYCICVTGLHL
jgi:hypothetical protein